MRQKSFFLALLAALLLLPALGSAAFPYVRASCYPVYLACIAAGCDPVQTDMFLMPQAGYMEDYAISEPDFARSQRADIVALLGGGLESFTAYLYQGGLKPLVVAGEHIRRIPGRVIDPDEDGSPSDNPYVWLSPARWGEMVHGISAALCRLDPENEAAYKRANEEAQAAVARVKDAMASELAFYAGRQVVVMHPALAYLALDAGLDVVLTLERDPSVQPLPGDVEELLALMGPYPEAVVLVEDTAPDALLTLPGRVIVSLSALTSGPLSGDATLWEHAMTQNIRTLKEALQK